MYPSQSRIDLTLIKTNTVQHILESWIEPDFWDTAMHHRAIGIRLNIHIKPLTPHQHANRTKSIQFRKKNTSQHQSLFITELNKTSTIPDDLESSRSPTDWHYNINMAAKSSKALRVKGLSTKNHDKKQSTNSDIKHIRQLHNLKMREQVEHDSAARLEMGKEIRSKTIILHKKVTGEDFIENSNIEDIYNKIREIVNRNSKSERRKQIKEKTEQKSQEYGSGINQKRHIINTLEHKNYQEPITYTRHHETKRIITEALEMKTSLLEN